MNARASVAEDIARDRHADFASIARVERGAGRRVLSSRVASSLVELARRATLLDVSSLMPRAFVPRRAFSSLIVRSLAEFNARARVGRTNDLGEFVDLALASSDDLRCVDLMCANVGDGCACRLAKAMERNGDRLRALCVKANKLRALPREVWALNALETLDASDNALDVGDVPFDALLAPSSALAPNLKTLNVSGNAKIVSGLGSTIGDVKRAFAKRGVDFIT